MIGKSVYSLTRRVQLAVFKNGFALMVILSSPISLLAQSEVAETESERDQTSANTPYEVVITGKVTRAYLRDLIVDVEEDFFEKFNELNQDDAYDMHCYKYTPTMSHIRKRVCEPIFMIKYRSQQSSNALGLMVAGGAGGDSNSLGSKLAGVYMESPEEMVGNHERYYKILVEKLEALTANNEELGQIASVMEQLKYRLENY